jgi:hypothetical protein
VIGPESLTLVELKKKKQSSSKKAEKTQHLVGKQKQNPPKNNRTK